jgi:hypothetical protein
MKKAVTEFKGYDAWLIALVLVMTTGHCWAAANRVLRLDRKTGCFEVSDSPSLHTLSNAVRLETWFKADSFYSNDGAVNSLIRKNTGEGAENFFLRFRTIGGQPWIEFSPGNSVGVVRASSGLATGQWHHLAGVYDGQHATIFLDGNSIKTTELSGLLVIDSSNLVVGRGDPEYSSGEFFHGALDEVRIWNVARSPKEIRSAMDKRPDGKRSGLIAYWNFDDGNAKDLSGHGNDGNIKGEAQIMEAPKPQTSQGDR